MLSKRGKGIANHAQWRVQVCIKSCVARTVYKCTNAWIPWILTNLFMGIMAAISQTPFLNAYSCMKNSVLLFEFHWHGRQVGMSSCMVPNKNLRLNIFKEKNFVNTNEEYYQIKSPKCIAMSKQYVVFRNQSICNYSWFTGIWVHGLTDLSKVLQRQFTRKCYILLVFG